MRNPPASGRCRHTTRTTTTPAQLQHRPRFGGPDSRPAPPSCPVAGPPHTATSRTTPPTRWGMPRAEPARLAAAATARGPSAEPAQMAAAPVAQEPRAEPAWRAVEAPLPAKARSDWVREGNAVPDPPGGETLPLVLEVYGRLKRATSGYLRNRPFDAVLLRRDRGSRKVPPRGWVAQGDHERVLRAVIPAGWPDRELGWPAFLEGGAVLRVTEAKADVWLPRALHAALIHWRYRPTNPPPPRPEPPQKRTRR